MRRINRDNWQPDDGFAVNELSVQHLFAEFKELAKSDNAMSLWRAADGETSINDVALALILPKQSRKQLSLFDVVWIPEGAARERGIAWSDVDGDTLVTDMIKKHVDIKHLDARRLVCLVDLIFEALSAGRTRRFDLGGASDEGDDTNVGIGDVLLQAVDDRRVGEANLPQPHKDAVASARRRRG